jgi:hypothetical protein
MLETDGDGRWIRKKKRKKRDVGEGSYDEIWRA